MSIEAPGDRDYVPIRVELNADGPAPGGVLAIRVAARQLGRRIGPVAAWMVDFEGVAASAADRWRSWFSRSPAVTSVPQAAALHAWWVLGANTVELGDGRHGVVPSKSKYVGIWAWDAYFHALALRHVDPELARDQFRIILGAQLPDGQLPDVVRLDGGTIAHTRDVPASEGRLMGRAEPWSETAADRVRQGAPLTKPPLAAWAVWKLHTSNPDQAFLSEVYEPLRRAHAWWFATSDPDEDGLPEYLHPYSAGIDDSPLFDLGLPVGSPDLPAYLVVGCDALATIAEALHLPADATYWRSEAARLTDRLVELRWDRAAGRFRSWTRTTQITTRTAFELMPLLTGRLPKPVARRLVSTLTDTSRFWTPFPVPTVAVDDPAFESSTMWRGPVWLNVNYMLIEGLFRSGYPAVARRLRERTLALVSSQADTREYYDPLTGGAPVLAASCFGWTAALFLDLAIDDRPRLGSE